MSRRAYSPSGAQYGAVARSEAKLKAKKEPAPHHDFEFGGPLGALVLMIALPLVIYLLYFLCPVGTDQYCASLQGLTQDWPSFTKHVDALAVQWDEIFRWDAVAVVLGWILFQVFLDRFLPADTVEGVKLCDGTRLKYRLNGHLAFWITLMIMTSGKPVLAEDGSFSGVTSFKLSYCYHHFLQLATASILVAAVLSVYLYAASFSQGRLLAPGGNTANPVYDFFIGRELNPRFSGSDFDLKEFCELKPGLIGWVIMNLGMAAAQQEIIGYVSLSMVAVNLFQGLYVWDALYNEKAVLTTMDITTDGFGFMLAFGDLCWVPFTYTLQARYLVEHDPHLSPQSIAAICALNCLGYAIFRGANGEKDAFRRDPTAPRCQHLKALDTKRGTKLLISGWWGLARKINYTGDWLMGLAWCLTTGTGTMLTYFYAIYFAILLIHRALRDDGFCYGKYGDDWDVYKKHVPYVFIPYIY